VIGSAPNFSDNGEHSIALERSGVCWGQLVRHHNNALTVFAKAFLGTPENDAKHSTLEVKNVTGFVTEDLVAHGPESLSQIGKDFRHRRGGRES
jgi:hypothetical protein